MLGGEGQLRGQWWQYQAGVSGQSGLGVPTTVEERRPDRGGDLPPGVRRLSTDCAPAVKVTPLSRLTDISVITVVSSSVRLVVPQLGVSEQHWSDGPGVAGSAGTVQTDQHLSPRQAGLVQHRQGGGQAADVLVLQR